MGIDNITYLTDHSHGCFSMENESERITGRTYSPGNNPNTHGFTTLPNVVEIAQSHTLSTTDGTVKLFKSDSLSIEIEAKLFITYTEKNVEHNTGM